MDTLDCIKTRRSIRKFLDKDIPEDIINKLLEAAVCAPSARDGQPWHFVIVKDKAIKAELAELKEENNQHHIMTAPVSIVVCVDSEKAKRYAEDGVTAAENILLAAHALGLGSVYVTGFNPAKPEVTAAVQKILSLPDNIIPITILPVGYPDPTEVLEKKELVDVKKITKVL